VRDAAKPGGTEPDGVQPTGRPGSVTAAVLVLSAQALAFLVLTVILLVKAATGRPHSLIGALVDAALALLGALVLGLGARALLALSPAARTPVVVIELLALPVSYDLAFQAGRPGYGAPILVSALAVLYLVFTPTSREALDRER
jgi:hypothetical protein